MGFDRIERVSKAFKNICNDISSQTWSIFTNLRIDSNIRKCTLRYNLESLLLPQTTKLLESTHKIPNACKKKNWSYTEALQENFKNFNDSTDLEKAGELRTDWKNLNILETKKSRTYLTLALHNIEKCDNLKISRNSRFRKLLQSMKDSDTLKKILKCPGRRQYPFRNMEIFNKLRLRWQCKAFQIL